MNGILKLITVCLIVFGLSCITNTKYGQCVGIIEEKDSRLEYSFSAWNALVSFVFIETVIVPVVWIFDCMVCPVGLKDDPINWKDK